MHHTGKKESNKKIFFKKETVTIYLLQRDSIADPQNQSELQVNASIHGTTSQTSQLQG